MTHLQLQGTLETIEELNKTSETARRLASQVEDARREIKIFTNTLKALEAQGQGKVSIGFCEGLLQSISEQLKN
jgi:hypothetical protein